MKCLIVIPHYGSFDNLERLLPSLKCEKFSREEIEKRPSTTLFTDYPSIKIMIWNNNIKNLGFTEACNTGIRYAMSGDFDYVWLLNNDTEVPDLALAMVQIENELSENYKTGVIGFKILAMDDPDFIHHGGTGACVPAGVHKVGRVSSKNYEKRTLERWVTGATFVISRRCLESVGALDPNMVNYGSDSDYCYRARLFGFDVVYLPIPVLHQIGQSAAPSEAQQRVLRSDMLYFQGKWLYGKAFYDLDKQQFNDTGVQ